MLRSRSVHRIHEMRHQGLPVAEIARTLGISRPTVRKYREGAPPAKARQPKRSKLDAYHEQVRRWVEQDHCTNCVSMLERLRPLGYTGGISQLKEFVHPLRPARAGKRPVLRYETKPGEQMQFDWGECTYEEAGVAHKVFGFLAILSYSRMRFAGFTKRADAPTLIRGLMAAFEYFGGLPQRVLTDRMKTVLVKGEDGGVFPWHASFSDFMASLGVTPRVCKPSTPQTKGQVERTVGGLKSGFWPGVTFTDLDDLHTQARAWCDRLNGQPHATTRVPPRERLREEALRPLPTDWTTNWAGERFATEERKVSGDGDISYDGVRYGLPARGPPLPGRSSTGSLAGTHVPVRERAGQVPVWSGGQRVLAVAKHAQSRAVVPHPDQFRGVASASAAVRTTTPLGHRLPAPTVVRRDLREYDRLYGVVSSASAAVAPGGLDSEGREHETPRWQEVQG
jgi:transposase